MNSDTFICPKCGFVQVYSGMDAATGNLYKNKKEKAERPCPNDGAELLPVFSQEELQ